MAKAKRRDKSRVVLRTGESQRADGTYHYCWTDANRKRRYVYAKTLDELRYKEEQIEKDKKDGIKGVFRMKYSKDFKEEALKLSDEVGVKKAAAQLGLPYYTLSDWRNKRKEEMKRPRLPETEAEKRIRELEKENAELKTANEILKDALGFFAKDRKK